jgi:hypothetical protein
MIKGHYDYIEQWQNEVFDNKAKEDLLKSLAISEVKRFAVFLSKRGISIDDEIIKAYADERNLKF